MDIRQATAADLEKIVVLLEEGFSSSAREMLIDDAKRQLSLGTSTSLVAIDHEEIVGYAMIKHTVPDKAHFGSLVVHKAYRNKGIANALGHARVTFLQKNNFQGIAQAEAVSIHPYSQRALSTAGFYPVRILLGKLPDHGAGPETSVSFLRIFSCAKIWKPENTPIPLYLASEYRDLAAEVLSPYGTPCFTETKENTTSERTRSFLSLDDPNIIPFFDVRLYEPTAPADIALLREKGYMFSGLTPIIKDGNVSAVTYMYRVPDVVLHKEKIQIIPAAKPLFDFVWEQYSSRKEK